MRNKNRAGFTLIELLVVIAIIAVLAVVVVLTLNPAELLRQSRDSTRLSDLATVKNAVQLFLLDTATSSIGVPWSIYLSITTTTVATPVFVNSAVCTWSGQWVLVTSSTLNNDCGLNSFNCSYYGLGPVAGLSPGNPYYNIPATTTAKARAIDGTGWVPVNFKAMSTGSPIPALPLDPSNQAGTCSGTSSTVSLSSCGLFYSFMGGNGDTDAMQSAPGPGTKFWLGAFMESKKYSAGGSADVESKNAMTSPIYNSTCVNPYEYFTGTATFTY